MDNVLPTDSLDILDLIHESLFLRDMEGRIVHWNRASEDLYGWSSDQAVGQNAHALLDAAHAAEIERFEADLMASGRWAGELRRTTAAGDEVIVDSSWSLRRDAQGIAVGILETGRDVTQKRRDEDALRRSEGRYSNLFHAMAASFWELDFSAVGPMVRGLGLHDADELRRHLAQNPSLVRRMVQATRVVDVNEQTIALFGHGSKQDLLLSIDPFWPDESLPVFAESLVAATTGRPNYATETRLQSIDGHKFDALFTACFSPESASNGLLTVGVIDISESKRGFEALDRERARYHHLFNYMPIALWQVNAQRLVGLFKGLAADGVTELGPYLDANPGFLEQAMEAMQVEEVNQRAVDLWGAGSAGELTGPLTHYWKENPGTFRRAMEARFSGKTFFQEETRFATADGRRIDTLFTAARPGPANDLDLSIVGLIDITERTRAQDQLRRVQADFAHSARVSMLGELVASIAHEVNQPLAAIATNGEAGLRWLNRPAPGLAEALKLMQRMVIDARRAADIIARIRSMASRRDPERIPLRIDEVIGESLVFLRHEIEARNVKVKLDLSDGPGLVLADRTQLQQVVVNLALNALQAMSGDNLRRTLTIRTLQHDDRRLRCVVEDSGPGIDAAQLEHLFDSFFTTKSAGMGMGLCICRTIIEGHGGSIGADNLAEHGGARFSFSLPSVT